MKKEVILVKGETRGQHAGRRKVINQEKQNKMKGKKGAAEIERG